MLDGSGGGPGETKEAPAVTSPPPAAGLADGGWEEGGLEMESLPADLVKGHHLLDPTLY